MLYMYMYNFSNIPDHDIVITCVHLYEMFHTFYFLVQPRSVVMTGVLKCVCVPVQHVPQPVELPSLLTLALSNRTGASSRNYLCQLPTVDPFLPIPMEMCVEVRAFRISFRGLQQGGGHLLPPLLKFCPPYVTGFNIYTCTATSVFTLPPPLNF